MHRATRRERRIDVPGGAGSPWRHRARGEATYTSTYDFKTRSASLGRNHNIRERRTIIIDALSTIAAVVSAIGTALAAAAPFRSPASPLIAIDQVARADRP